jgi:hypothetical protein
MEKEIEMIRRKNQFTCFTIDQVYHRENQDVLADAHNYRPVVDAEFEGLEPLVISRVVVGRRHDQDSDREM